MGAHSRESERRGEGVVQRRTSPLGCLRDQMSVQVHGRGDGLVPEPPGHLGDGYAFSECGTGEGVPQIVGAP
jgi:hypothetical protein